MITPDGQQTLLQVAADSIYHGLIHQLPLEPVADAFAEELRPLRATFVTLHRYGELRGCIGMLEAVRPLVQDVAHNAYAAAFFDPRFPPLTRPELTGLDLHISILSPPEPLEFSSEQELIGRLRPGVDGLILRLGELRGTFLPSVWESLGEPRAFLQHLKLKAGLPADFWSGEITVERYTTEAFGAALPPPRP